MVPELEISSEQIWKVHQWATIKRGKHLASINLAKGKAHLDAYQINGEPLVIISRGIYVGEQLKGVLYCSDNHAKRLEEAGIVGVSATEVAEH